MKLFITWYQPPTRHNESMEASFNCFVLVSNHHQFISTSLELGWEPLGGRSYGRQRRENIVFPATGTYAAAKLCWSYPKLPSHLRCLQRSYLSIVVDCCGLAAHCLATKRGAFQQNPLEPTWYLSGKSRFLDFQDTLWPLACCLFDFIEDAEISCFRLGLLTFLWIARGHVMVYGYANEKTFNSKKLKIKQIKHWY